MAGGQCSLMARYETKNSSDVHSVHSIFFVAFYTCSCSPWFFAACLSVCTRNLQTISSDENHFFHNFLNNDWHYCLIQWPIIAEFDWWQAVSCYWTAKVSRTLYLPVKKRKSQPPHHSSRYISLSKFTIYRKNNISN